MSLAVTALVAAAGSVALQAQDKKPEEKKPAEKKPEEKKRWESTASVGITLSRGNSKGFLASAGLITQRKWSKDEILLGANGGYGESTAVRRADKTKDVTTKSDDYLKGFGQWNHLFTERLYGGLRLDGVHDDIADVNYRVTVSPLLGYYLVKRPATTLAAEVGPSYIYEQVGGETHGYFGVRAGERFEHKFKTGARVWQKAEIIPQVDEWENYIVNLELGAEAPITKRLSLRAVAQDTYDNQPAEVRGAAGTHHKLKNDLKLIAGLAYKF